VFQKHLATELSLQVQQETRLDTDLFSLMCVLALLGLPFVLTLAVSPCWHSRSEQDVRPLISACEERIKVQLPCVRTTVHDGNRVGRC
jgi:hypothetical protein